MQTITEVAGAAVQFKKSWKATSWHTKWKVGRTEQFW